MLIETKLYKAFTQIINSQRDYSDLKDFLNRQFESFAGNKLNPSKLDVFASRFIGLKGPNVVSFVFDEKIDDAQALYRYCYDHGRQIFHKLGTLHNEADDYFCFYTPLISFEMQEEDQAELDLTLTVTVSFANGNMNISHTLIFIDEELGEFYEIPTGWDLSEDKAIDLIENKLGLGRVKSKKLCHIAERLMSFLPTDSFDTLMIVQDISSSVATQVAERINLLTHHKMRMEYTNMFSYDDPKLHHYRTDFAVPEEPVLAADDEDDEENEDFE